MVLSRLKLLQLWVFLGLFFSLSAFANGLQVKVGDEIEFTQDKEAKQNTELHKDDLPFGKIPKGTRASVIQIKLFKTGRVGVVLHFTTGNFTGQKAWIYTNRNQLGIKKIKSKQEPKSKKKPDAQKNPPLRDISTSSGSPSTSLGEVEGEPDDALMRKVVVEAGQLGPVVKRAGIAPDCVSEEIKRVQNLKKSTKNKGKNKDCDPPNNGVRKEKIALDDPRRANIQQWVLEAANEFGLHPALILAILHAESDLKPFSENLHEKECRVDGHCGKGMAQFMPSTAKEVGLNWYASHPKEIEVYEEKNNPKPDFTENGMKKYPNGYSVWSPRAAIYGLAKYLTDFWNHPSVPILSKDKKEKIHFDYVYKGPDSYENARYLAARYNAGGKVNYALTHYYINRGSFPEYYGNLISKLGLTPEHYKEHRTYIYTIAGLCGEDQGSLFAQYAEDFELHGDGQWYSK